ncbi:MAG: hypothetical protein R3B68_13370 [Phycisphaerales bacterium]
MSVATSKALRQRALLVVEALVGTLAAIGCVERPSTDRRDRTVLSEPMGFRFLLRVRERTRRTAHVLTEEEQRSKARNGYSYAPKHDDEHTGELSIDAFPEGSSLEFAKFKDGPKAGPVEDRIGDVATAVIRHADQELRRAHERKLAAQLERERQRRAAEEAERRRVEDEQRRQEQACRDRLVRVADDWHAAQLIRRLLEATQSRLASETLEPEAGNLLERWMRWGHRVADELDPERVSLAELPELTHPGVREQEARERAAARNPT